MGGPMITSRMLVCTVVVEPFVIRVRNRGSKYVVEIIRSIRRWWQCGHAHNWTTRTGGTSHLMNNELVRSRHLMAVTVDSRRPGQAADYVTLSRSTASPVHQPILIDHRVMHNVIKFWPIANRPIVLIIYKDRETARPIRV